MVFHWTNLCSAGRRCIARVCSDSARTWHSRLSNRRTSLAQTRSPDCARTGIPKRNIQRHTVQQGKLLLVLANSRLGTSRCLPAWQQSCATARSRWTLVVPNSDWSEPTDTFQLLLLQSLLSLNALPNGQWTIRPFPCS